MTPLAARSPRYRNIVFVDDLTPPRPALDLTPRPIPARPGATVEPGGPLSADDEEFVRWLLRFARLNVDDYKPATLARRLPACLRALRAYDTTVARRQIERVPRLATVALGTMVIGVTSFFRDAQAFHDLAASVLPDLLGRAGPLRVWCVGCSDGAEVYSVAMLIAEAGALPRAQLLGTDCRDDAARRCAAGVYSADEMRSVPRTWRDAYFTAEPQQQWRARSDLRAALHVRTANVLDLREPGQFDLILCRNVAIYLQPDAAARLWGALQESLRPWGVLMLGKAERPTGATKLSPIGPGLFRRNRG